MGARSETTEGLDCRLDKCSVIFVGTKKRREDSPEAKKGLKLKRSLVSQKRFRRRFSLRTNGFSSSAPPCCSSSSCNQSGRGIRQNCLPSDMVESRSGVFWVVTTVGPFCASTCAILFAFQPNECRFSVFLQGQIWPTLGEVVPQKLGNNPITIWTVLLRPFLTLITLMS